MQKTKSRLSAIILTKNSIRTIEKCIQSVFQQTHKPDEVVVVDGNSDDGTLKVIGKYPVVLVTEPGLGYGYARNVGLESAKYDIVAFVDSDIVLEQNYFEELVSVLESAEDNVGGVGGVSYSLDDSLISESFNVRLFGYSPLSETKIREIDSIAGGVSAYHRELLIKIGGFDVHIRGAEDFDLNLRLRKSGYKVLLVPSAKTYHLHPNSMKSLLKKWFSYGQFLVDVSVKDNLKKDIIFSWSWIFSCLLLLAIALLIGQILVWVLLIADFCFPWILYYGRQTVRFWIHNPKAKYLVLPFIHQMCIISRSFGVISATLSYLLRTNKKKITPCQRIS